MVMKMFYRRPVTALMALMVILFSTPGFAQVYATVSKNQVTQNELFQLRIVADKKVSGDAIDFSALDKDFQTLGRPSFGTSLNIINGKRSTRSEWNLNIAARHSGVVTIPAFTLDGERSQPIALQVAADSATLQNQNLVEINTRFDDLTLYPKQSTIMHVELVIKADTRRLQDPQITPPSANGVQLESASEPDQSQQIINGIQSTIVKQDFRITALKPGSYSVTEPQFDGQLLYSGYNGDTRIVPLHTKAKTFTISVLDKPNQYQGVWLPTSYLTLTQQWQDSAGKKLDDNATDNVSVGDPMTRIITLTVRGVSQEQVPSLAIDYPQSLRVYSEKPQYQALTNGDLAVTLKQVLIPNQSGNITIPGMTLNWWDTQARTQRKALLSSKKLNVSGQTTSTPAALPALTPAPVESCPPPAPVSLSSTGGFWRYLALVFGLLWLATSAAWLYHSKRPGNKADTNVTPAESDNFTRLQQAVRERDGFKVNALLQRWIDESGFSAEQIQTLDQAKQKWLAQHYSSSPDAGDNSEFLQVLNKLNKARRKKPSKTDNVLPDL